MTLLWGGNIFDYFFEKFIEIIVSTFPLKSIIGPGENFGDSLRLYAEV